jgi:hypothetical protein
MLSEITIRNLPKDLKMFIVNNAWNFQVNWPLKSIYFLRSDQLDSAVPFFATKTDYLFQVNTFLVLLKQPTQVPNVKFVDLHERKLRIRSFCSYHSNNIVRKAKW